MPRLKSLCLLMYVQIRRHAGTLSGTWPAGGDRVIRRDIPHDTCDFRSGVDFFGKQFQSLKFFFFVVFDAVPNKVFILSKGVQWYIAKCYTVCCNVKWLQLCEGLWKGFCIRQSQGATLWCENRNGNSLDYIGSKRRKKKQAEEKKWAQNTCEY